MIENKPTLVYVEDDEALAFVTVRALEAKGFDVKHFFCVDTAMVQIPHLVANFALLDLKVGDRLSLELISSLISANASVRTIVLTGYGSIVTAVQAIKLGATDYLTKPATIDAILKAMHGKADSVNNCQAVSDGKGYSLKRLEWENIQRVLKENDGNVSATARQLKMHRRTLQRKLDKRPVGQ